MDARAAANIFCLILPICEPDGPFFELPDHVYERLQHLIDEYDATQGRVRPVTLWGVSQAFDVAGKPEIAKRIALSVQRVVHQQEAENQNVLLEVERWLQSGGGGKPSDT